MKITADTRLFWFLKENSELDLSQVPILDMYIQQVLTHGKLEDVRKIFTHINIAQFKESFLRIKRFIPEDVRNFWEDFLGDNQQASKRNT